MLKTLNLIYVSGSDLVRQAGQGAQGMPESSGFYNTYQKKESGWWVGGAFFLEDAK